MKSRGIETAARLAGDLEADLDPPSSAPHLRGPSLAFALRGIALSGQAQDRLSPGVTWPRAAVFCLVLPGSAWFPPVPQGPPTPCRGGLY